MTLFPQYQAAYDLEHYLGNPMDSERVFSFKRVIELDEQERYPTEICDVLNQWNFGDYYIPESVGGKLTSFEEILAIGRVVSRRDLTVTIAHGVTYLGSAVIWVGGNDSQKQKLAARIQQGQKVAFGLTEKAHGSDILASETHAEKVDGGYVLSGEKWLIGNGTRSEAIALFTRTNPKGGPRGFSWFLVEKEHLDPATYSHLPKIKTHGLRGADISGIRFNQSFVPDEALISTAGSGLELALKALQITRTIHAGAAPSLGQADTALRVTLDFVLSRQLYGDSLWHLPNIRQNLVNAFLDILICDCLSTAVVRALHTAPEQMSLFSATVKYFVPATVERLISELSSVLGARYYLREEYCWGIFQKIVRDHAIVSVFDGSAAVNLNGIVLQLHQLASCRTTSKETHRQLTAEICSATFTLERSLPAFYYQQLALYNRGQDHILQGLENALVQLSAMETMTDLTAEVLNQEVLSQIIALTRHLLEQIHQQDESLLDLGMQTIAKNSKSAQLFSYAKRYCVFQAASACVQFWLYNRQSLGPFFAQGEWLVCCLQKLLHTLEGNKLNEKSSAKPSEKPSLDTDLYRENMANELLRLYQEREMISICPFSLT